MRRISQLAKLFTDKSIPINSANDVIALFRHSLKNCQESIQIDNHIRLHTPQMSALHAFQALQLVFDNTRHTKLSLDLLVDLQDVLQIHRFRGLSANEIVRAVSILADVQGPHWDPKILSEWVAPYISHLTAAGLISLCESGMFDIVGLSNAAVLLSDSNRLSSVEAAQLAFWTGKRDILPSTVPIAAIPSVIFGYSAWKWDAYSDDLEIQLVKSLHIYTPADIQKSLLALLAMGRQNETTAVLFENAGVWINSAEKNLCEMALDPLYIPPYPVRIPQIGVARKSKLTKDIHFEKKFILDSDDGKAVQFYTFENDPHWRILRNFLPPNVPILSLVDA